MVLNGSKFQVIRYGPDQVPAFRDLNYWDQLKHLKMLSLQSYAPNCGIKASQIEDRSGRKCSMPKVNNKSSVAVKTMKEQTFQVHGSQLFNALPAFLRKTTKCSIDDIPDEPSVKDLTPLGCTSEARPSNSILNQIGRVPGLQRRGQGS